MEKSKNLNHRKKFTQYSSNYLNKYVVTKVVLIILAYFSEILLLYTLFLNPETINFEIIKLIDFSKILPIIIASLATLLAIVFALSQFILSNIVDKYSVQIIDKYEKSSKNRLFIIYILIIVFAFLLLIIPNSDNNIILVLVRILIIYYFIISFVFLIDYINYMFILINPLKFADVQKKDIMMAIIGHEENDVKLEIMAIGDIAIKLMRKGEEKVCLEYIDKLIKIYLEFIALREKSPELYKVEVYMVYEKGETKNNVMEYVVNEYLRIYKESVTKKQDVISQQIVDNLFKIVNGVMHAR